MIGKYRNISILVASALFCLFALHGIGAAEMIDHKYIKVPIVSATNLIEYIEDPRVSVVNLIATPEKYHNKNIFVIGYVTIGLERVAVYLDEESGRRSISKNGIWLNFKENVDYIDLRKKYNEQYCKIRGVFDSQGKGHLESFSGEINVTKIDILALPPDFRN